MENLEQIEQEETLPQQPSPRKKYLLVGSIIILILLVGGGIFLFQNLSKQYLPKHEGDIQFTVLSQRVGDGKEEIFIRIETTEIFGCSNVDLLIDYEKVGQVLTFAIGRTHIDGDICLTSLGNAGYKKLLALEAGNYNLRFVSESKLDSYDMHISAEEITITPQTGSFSSALTTNPESTTQDETDSWQTYRNEEFGFEIKYPSRWTFDVPQVREEEPYLIIGFEMLTPDSVSVGFQMSIYDSDPGDPDPSTQCTKTGKTITVSGKEYEKCLYLVGEGALAGWYLTIVNKGFIYDFEVDDSDIPDEVISTLQFIE